MIDMFWLGQNSLYPLLNRECWKRFYVLLMPGKLLTSKELCPDVLITHRHMIKGLGKIKLEIRLLWKSVFNL